MNSRIIFITGGARSGKSRFALGEASNIHGEKAYIATAEALDEEMKERIERHRMERGDEWDTYEEPIELSNVLRDMKDRYSVVVIDCLTMWLSNLIHRNLSIYHKIEELINILRTDCYASCIYIVSNEVGMGIVPDNEMARHFRDMAGFLNQRVAEVADEMYMIIAGIPVRIKY